MTQLLAFFKRFQEFLAPLLDYAQGFRGFLAFAAFLVIAAIVFSTLVFPQGSFSQILENFGRLEPEQFFILMFVAIVMIGVLLFSLVGLSYRDAAATGDGYTLYVVVHEESDPTRPIAHATVSLTLDEAISLQTSERGGAAFTFGRKWHSRKCQINARHAGYKTREPLTVELRPAERIFIPLQPKSTDEAALDPTAERVFISYSPGNARAAASVAALLRRGRFFVWKIRREFDDNALALDTEQVIRRSDYVVALVSHRDDTSPTIFNETAFAMDVQKPVVAVRLEPDVAMRGPLRGHEPIDIYRNWGLEGERLCKVLRRLGSKAARPGRRGPLEPQVEKPRPNINPFVFGSAVREDLFTGRKNTLNTISGRLGLELQSVSIVANRRMGKTSLLNYVTRRYQQLFPSDFRWTFIYMDMMDARTHTINGVMRLMRRGIAQHLGREPWPEQYDGNLGIMAEQFEELAESQTRLVLCLDEWESVMARPEMEPFIEQLRASGSLFKIGMIVSTAHELCDLTRSGGLSSPFYNIFETTYLGLMPPNEWQEIVHRAYRGSHWEINEREITLIGVLAGGHPYLTQVAGALVWDARKNGWNPAEIYKRYNQQARPLFANLWSRQTEAQKTAVRAAMGISSNEPLSRDVWEGLKLRGVLTEKEEVFCRPFADFIMAREL